MTVEEASHYLDLQEGEDLQEAYIRQLFFFKTFFISSKIIYSLFQQKMIKLQKFEDAFDVMGMKTPCAVNAPNVQFVPSNFLVEAYNNYQLAKSEILRDMHQVVSFQELIGCVRVLLKINSDFISLWVDLEVDVEAIKLTDEPDPVEFLDTLRKASGMGVSTFSDLREVLKGKRTKINDLPDLLPKESMRLYLLAKKELEWKKRLID